MDTQTACRLQAEEQSKGQYLSFQTAKQVDTDCISQPALAPHKHNRQNLSMGQVRSNRCSKYS